MLREYVLEGRSTHHHLVTKACLQRFLIAQIFFEICLITASMPREALAPCYHQGSDRILTIQAKPYRFQCNVSSSQSSSPPIYSTKSTILS